MRFTTIDGQPLFSELVDQLFDVPARRASPLRKAAEQALRDANPQLANVRKVPRGTPILVPDVPGVAPIPEDRPAPAPWDDLAKDLARALASAEVLLASSVKRQEEEHKQTTTLLAAREVRAAAREDPELQKQIDEIAAAARTRLEESKARAAEQAQGLAALAEDLKAFREGIATRSVSSTKP